MDWQALIRVTLRLYWEVARETAQRLKHAWWVGLLPFLYWPLYLLALSMIAPFGLAGGLLLGLVRAVFIGSYIYFIAGAVRGSRMNLLRDVGDSCTSFFGPVITILFFLMVVDLTLQFFPGGAAQQALWVMATLLLPIFLSPVPEIIYQGRSQGFAMLQESVDFLRESSVEWFAPLILASFGLSTLFLVPFLSLTVSLLFPLPNLILPGQFRGAAALVVGAPLLGSAGQLVNAVVGSLLLYAIMVFRGLLFRALSTSSRRQRLFRARLDS